MNYVTETSLFVGLQSNGYEKIWSYFYDKYAPLISRFALRTGVPAEDVCDVLQETMLALYMALPSFQYDPKKGKFRNYVLLITSRKCSRYFSKKNKLPVSTDPVDLDWLRNEEFSNGEIFGQNQASSSEFYIELIAMALDQLKRKKRITTSTYLAYKQYALENEHVSNVTKDLDMTSGQLYRIKNRINQMILEEIQLEDSQDCEIFSRS